MRMSDRCKPPPAGKSSNSPPSGTSERWNPTFAFRKMSPAMLARFGGAAKAAAAMQWAQVPPKAKMPIRIIGEPAVPSLKGRLDVSMPR